MCCKALARGAVVYLQKLLNIYVTQAKVKVFEKLFRYQQELKLPNHELVRVNKHLERFVYMVLYDLKSPLASITSLMLIIKDSNRIQPNKRLHE